MTMLGPGTFVRDGQHYSGFLPGSSLLDAVRGNPRAEHEARAARNLELGSWLAALSAAGTLTGAVIADSDNTHSHDNLATGLLITSLVCDTVGFVLAVSSVPHVYDGMNIYNDDLERHAGQPSGSVEPSASVTKPLLGPRRSVARQ